MVKNFLKTAFRSLMKNKGFTLINVLGLAIGLASCLLIVFYVYDELRFDRYNANALRIYRIDEDVKFNGNASPIAVCPAPLAATLASSFPSIERVVRFRQTGIFHVKKGNQNLQEDRVTYCDPSIFKVFSLPAITGSTMTALTEPNSIVISETAAKKYFNRTNVVGETLVFNDTQPYKVNAVIKDIPFQSHFHFDFFISMPTLAESREPSWLSSNFQTYILLKQGADPHKIEAGLKGIVKNYIGTQLQSALHQNFADFEKSGNYFRLELMPLSHIHLYSNKVAEMGENGSIQYVYIFAAIAIFIMLIACVNFMNLSTARSANRAKEVGVRKVLGSPKKYLVAQFLTESFLVTMMAAVIAVAISWLILPYFNQLSGKELQLNNGTAVWMIPGMFILVAFIGLLAGFYPAFYLSSFKPVMVLKGKLASGFKSGLLRSFLVVFQFAISVFLIIGTLVIHDQLKFIQSKDLGFKREQVLVIQNVSAIGRNAKLLQQQLKQLPGVANATLTGYIPINGYRNNGTLFKSSGMEAQNGMLTQIWSIDPDYIPTMGIKLVAGRNFSKDMSTDSSAIIINESALRMLALTDPLNKPLYQPMDDFGKKVSRLNIIGVVKDFNFSSLRDNITPLIFKYEPDNGMLSLRIRTAGIHDLIGQMEKTWRQFAPSQQFTYTFMDADFDKLYRSEQRMGQISIGFTSMAIIIACLGLFGLAAYAAEQRTKEISIRKVLGARVSTIVGMLSLDFIKLVFIAIIVSTPLAWWAMSVWLRGFAYREKVSPWILVGAGLIAVVIAFSTISFQSIRAALANPVKSLKN